MAAKNSGAPKLKTTAAKVKATAKSRETIKPRETVKPREDTKPKPTRDQEPSMDASLIIEIISIAALMLSFLLILSIYTENGAGTLGQAVAGVIKGLFGVGAYMIPIIIVFISVYTLLTENKYFSTFQVALGFIIFMVIISLFHILTSSAIPTYDTATELISSNYKSGNFSNGGLFGAIFALFFVSLLGKLGASVLLAAIAIVSGIMLTRYSLVGFIKTVGTDVKNRPRRMRTAAPDKPITVDSIKHRRVEVYDAPPVIRKQKVFNHVVEDVERTSDEREIHIITGGKKITRETFKRGEQKKPQENMNDSKAEEKPQAVEEKIQAPEKPQMNEYFVESPRLNFNIVDEEEEEIQDLPKLNFDIVDDAEIQEEKPKMGIAFTVVETENKPYEKSYDKAYEAAEHVQEIKKPPEREHMPTIIEAAPTKLAKQSNETRAEYVFPSIEMLKKNPSVVGAASKAQILENSKKLEDTLRSFGVEAKVIEVSMGPAVTRYELSPGQGVKVSRISGLADDLALNLAAAGIRIEAPIPGKAAVGIEVPNKEVQAVYLREVIEVEEFAKFPSSLAFALGKDIAGNTIVADIAKMPHLLIAGATGSGKSVCINTLITSILYKASPDDVKLLMVDPKVVELSVYNGIPHLLIPVVTDPKKAAGALNWAVKEMISRYNSFAETSVRDLKGYNRWLEENDQKPLPQIVIVVDELSDLMMVAQNEVEDAICRLAQMARAAGLHLVIATQRPSVDVITGLIKANVPSRIAFSVSSGTDSRTILDMTGAEKLLGKGDMLFYPSGMNKPLRVQGAFISDKEVESIVNFLKENNSGTYDDAMIERITSSGKSADGGDEEADDLFTEAVDFIVQKDRASVSMLQRRFRIGYNRAARLMEDLEERGFVEAGDGSKPRKVSITSFEWSEYKERNGL